MQNNIICKQNNTDDVIKKKIKKIKKTIKKFEK